MTMEVKNKSDSLLFLYNLISNFQRIVYLKTCLSSVSSFSLINRSSSNLSMIIAYASLIFFFHSSIVKKRKVYKS